MPQPLVSVIMPVYNVEEFLDASLRSVEKQTYQNLDIIVVNDGSTDSSLDIAQQHAAHDYRINIVTQKNGGVSAARNTGLLNAKGEYIYFCDPDDEIDSTLVEKCLTAMGKFNADVVMFQFDTISTNNAVLKSNYTHNNYRDIEILNPEEAIKKQLHGDIAGYFWTFIAKTSIYQSQNVSFPVGRKIEDLARICTILGSASRIVRLPEVLYHYRLRSGSLLGQITPSIISDWSKAVEDREDYILEHYPQLKQYMIMQSLNFLNTLDYESMRQSLIFGLKLDPDSIEERFNKRLAKINKAQADQENLTANKQNSPVKLNRPRRKYRRVSSQPHKKRNSQALLPSSLRLKRHSNSRKINRFTRRKDAN